MLKIRPVIKVETKPENQLAMELFQNKTLRPIIKMQHDLLLILFFQRMKNSSIKWEELKNHQKIEVVKKQISFNMQFKNLILGSIIGQLNQSELSNYLLSTKEYNKRIIQMVTQRIISTF